MTEREVARLANIIGRMEALQKETRDQALRQRLRVALTELKRGHDGATSSRAELR
jgi:hypothetical protein